MVGIQLEDKPCAVFCSAPLGLLGER